MAMAVFDTFSKRERRRLNSGQVDPLQYENLPEGFRIQVVHILGDTIGRFDSSISFGPYEERPYNDAWIRIQKIIAKEHRLMALHDGAGDPDTHCVRYFF